MRTGSARPSESMHHDHYPRPSHPSPSRRPPRPARSRGPRSVRRPPRHPHPGRVPRGGDRRRQAGAAGAKRQQERRARQLRRSSWSATPGTTSPRRRNPRAAGGPGTSPSAPSRAGRRCWPTSTSTAGGRARPASSPTACRVVEGTAARSLAGGPRIYIKNISKIPHGARDPLSPRVGARCRCGSPAAPPGVWSSYASTWQAGACDRADGLDTTRTPP